MKTPAEKFDADTKLIQNPGALAGLWSDKPTAASLTGALNGACEAYPLLMAAAATEEEQQQLSVAMFTTACRAGLHPSSREWNFPVAFDRLKDSLLTGLSATENFRGFAEFCGIMLAEQEKQTSQIKDQARLDEFKGQLNRLQKLMGAFKKIALHQYQKRTSVKTLAPITLPPVLKPKPRNNPKPKGQ